MSFNSTMWINPKTAEFRFQICVYKKRVSLFHEASGTQVTYNTHKVNEKARIFIMDEDDCTALETGKVSKEASTLELFVAEFPTKKLYLRTFSFATIDREENKRVFTSDLLEMIPILLKKQEMTMDEKKMVNYSNKWKMEDGCYSTIGLYELREVLDDFGIDKSQLTLVPDIFHFRSLEMFITNFGTAPIMAKTAENISVFSIPSTIFTIFKEFVTTVDWKTALNGPHHRLANQAKKMIIKVMNDFNEMDEGTYLSTDRLSEIFTKIRSSDFYTRYRLEYTPPSFLGKCDFNDRISIKYFAELAEEFRIPGISSTILLKLLNMEDSIIPAWKAHAIFMEKWMEDFFGNKLIGLKNKVKTGIQHLIPLREWTDEDDFMNVILMKDEEKQEYVWELCFDAAVDLLNERRVSCVNWKNNKNIIRSRKWVHEDILLSMTSKNQNTEEYLNKASHDILTHLKQEKEKNVEMDKKSVIVLARMLSSNHIDISVDEFHKVMKMASQEEGVTGMIKLVRKGSEMTITNEELPMTSCFPFSSFSTLEVKPKEDSVEDCLELQQNISSNEKNDEDLLLTPPTTSSSCSSDSEIKPEVKKTKKKKSKKTSEIPASPEPGVSPTEEKTSDGEPIRCHKCFKSSQKSREARTKMKLSENRNEKLEKKLRAAERRIEELEVKLKESEQKVIDQSVIISKKDEEMEEMKTKIMDLESSLQKSQKNCEQLEEELKELKVKESKFNEMEKEIDLLKDENIQKSKAIKALVVRSTSTGMCSETRQILNELEEKKTELHKKKPDRDVKKKADSVIHLTDITHIQIETRVECAQFQKKYNEYKDALELNIQIIKLNPSVLPYNLPSIPKFPSLSSDFMKRYKEIVESQELDDMDCSICLVEMNPKLNETLKCTHCRRRFHELCGMEWKFQRDICPTCNQTPWPLERIPYLL